MAQMLLRPPDWLKAVIQDEAKRMGITVNALSLQILNDWAQRNGMGKDSADEKAACSGRDYKRLEKTLAANFEE